MQMKIISRHEGHDFMLEKYVESYEVSVDTNTNSVARTYESGNKMVVRLLAPKSEYHKNEVIKTLWDWSDSEYHDADYFRDFAVTMRVMGQYDKTIVFTCAELEVDEGEETERDMVALTLTLVQKKDQPEGVVFGEGLDETYEAALATEKSPAIGITPVSVAGPEFAAGKKMFDLSAPPKERIEYAPAYNLAEQMNKALEKGNEDLKQIIEQSILDNYNFNTNLSFTQGTYIYGQGHPDASLLKVGCYEGSYNGCGIVATYNAITALSLRSTGTWRHPAAIVKYMDDNDGYTLLSSGIFGVKHSAIKNFLVGEGYSVNSYGSPKDMDNKIKNATTAILLFRPAKTIENWQDFGQHYVNINYDSAKNVFWIVNERNSDKFPRQYTSIDSWVAGTGGSIRLITVN